MARSARTTTSAPGASEVRLPRPRRAFTLTELLVTLAIIVVVMSISVGVLSRFGNKDELVATQQAIRSLLRRARNAAREERYGVLIEIDAKASELRAHQKTAITQFRFEEATPLEPEEGGSSARQPVAEGEQPPPPELQSTPGARGYEMRIEHSELAKGKYGLGVLFEHSKREQVSWGYVEDRPALSPLEGLYLECWVLCGQLTQKLHKRRGKGVRRDDEQRYKRAGEPPRVSPERLVDFAENDPPLFTIVRKGKAYGLSVTANYELELALTGKDEAGAEVTWISRTAKDVIRANRWARLGFAFDGRRVRIFVNGIARVHLPLTGYEKQPARLIRDKAPLVVSDSDPQRAFYGVIDEVKVAGIIRSQRLPIPPNIALIAPDRVIGFDILGQLDPARHAEPFALYLCNADNVWEVLDPPAQKTGKIRSRTRKELKAEREREKKRNMHLGQQRFQRFLKAVPNLDPTRVRRVVVGRTGLVTN